MLVLGVHRVHGALKPAVQQISQYGIADLLRLFRSADDGDLLAKGTPSNGPEGLPSLRERQQNFLIVKGSKYAREAAALARTVE